MPEVEKRVDYDHDHDHDHKHYHSYYHKVDSGHHHKEKEYASKGVANTALALGATALGIEVLGGLAGGLLGRGRGLFGGHHEHGHHEHHGHRGHHEHNRHHVDRFELHQSMEIDQLKSKINSIEARDCAVEKSVSIFEKQLCQIEKFTAEKDRLKEKLAEAEKHLLIKDITATNARIDCLEKTMVTGFREIAEDIASVSNSINPRINSAIEKVYHKLELHEQKDECFQKEVRTCYVPFDKYINQAEVGFIENCCDHDKPRLKSEHKKAA